MQLLWSKKRLTDLLMDFYLVSGIRVGFFGVDASEITAYPKEYSPYCREVRKKAESECLHCDRLAYSHAKNSAESYLYQCHAGMYEMVVPIRDRERLMGFLMMGQIRTLKTGQLTKDIVLHLKNMGLDAEQLMLLFNNTAVTDIALLKSYSRILKACAAYVLTEKFIRIQGEPLSLRVEGFICENISKPLNINLLCSSFGIGKTTLCNEVKKGFNLTVNELIQQRRVEEAERLLQKTDAPINEIAERVGISDYNYFTKVFKKQTGVTPSVYRKLCRNEMISQADATRTRFMTKG